MQLVNVDDLVSSFNLVFQLVHRFMSKQDNPVIYYRS